jgi:hypothetical protein
MGRDVWQSVGNVKETIAADWMAAVLTAYQDGKAEDVIRVS